MRHLRVIGNVGGALHSARAAAALLAAFLLSSGAAAQQGREIDINEFRETFSEDFRGTLDVTPWGPSKWIAHTPWNGDFGDARFSDPLPDFPFKTGPDGLTITARKGQRGWESGLLATRDRDRRGFAQSLGYFEARMKMPEGPGVWPAFWLVSEGDGKEKIEVDIVEFYGHNPNVIHHVVHVWSQQVKGAVASVPKRFRHNAPIPDSFHTFGAEVTAREIVFYFDRKETWRTPAPPSATQPLMLLVNLALGSGWPIDKTPDPSVLKVDYVKAFARLR